MIIVSAAAGRFIIELFGSGIHQNQHTGELISARNT